MPTSLLRALPVLLGTVWDLGSTLCDTPAFCQLAGPTSVQKWGVLRVHLYTFYLCCSNSHWDPCKFLQICVYKRLVAPALQCLVVASSRVVEFKYSLLRATQPYTNIVLLMQFSLWVISQLTLFRELPKWMVHQCCFFFLDTDLFCNPSSLVIKSSFSKEHFFSSAVLSHHHSFPRRSWCRL